MKQYCPSGVINIEFFGCDPQQIRRVWFTRKTPSGIMLTVEATAEDYAVQIPSNLCQGVWTLRVKTDCKCYVHQLYIICGAARVAGQREVTNERNTIKTCCPEAKPVVPDPPPTDDIPTEFVPPDQPIFPMPDDR